MSWLPVWQHFCIKFIFVIANYKSVCEQHGWLKHTQCILNIVYLHIHTQTGMKVKSDWIVSVRLNKHAHVHTPVIASLNWSISCCNYQVPAPSAPCRQWPAVIGVRVKGKLCGRAAVSPSVTWWNDSWATAQTACYWACQQFSVALRLTIQQCVCGVCWHKLK